MKVMFRWGVECGECKAVPGDFKNKPDPLDPLDSLDLLDPLDPLDLLDPLDPLDPLDQLDPLDPLDPLGCSALHRGTIGTCFFHIGFGCPTFQGPSWARI